MIRPTPLTHRIPLDGPPIEYRAYVPTRVRARSALAVVHGASRDAATLFRAFLPAAIEHGIAVVGPEFSESTYAGFQRLAGRAGPLAAADAFCNVLRDAGEVLELPVDRVHLVGYSGGAQFAHRFAMLRPDLVRSVVLASAGWYTLLDARRRFPFGTQGPVGADQGLDLREFLKLPIHLLVGERDTGRDRLLRTSGSMDARQGPHRLARALNWIDHVEDVARREGVPSHVSFDLLPGSGHSFRAAVGRGGLVERAVTFSLRAEVQVAGRGPQERAEA